MGWTFEQLDASGLARPLPGVTKANAYILILVVAQSLSPIEVEFQSLFFR